MTDLLLETPDNRIPENAVAGMLATPDGTRIRYARFAAQGRPLKGTVLIIPGRNEFIEKYFETIGNLSARGFGTVVFDLRGQGGSDRLLRDPWRGYISNFAHYADDIDPLFQEVILPDCRGPYYVLAHSTGALVALLASPSLTNRVERMVLASPLLGLPDSRLSMRNTRLLSGTLNALGLGTVYLGGRAPLANRAPFSGNVLTSDPIRYQRNMEFVSRHPQLGIGGPTAAWVRAACDAIDYVNQTDFIAAIRVPALIFTAGNDRVVDSRAAQLYARKLRAGSHLTIDGARHELLQEADLYREQMLAAFDAFIPGSD